ncbi:hypothetical protein KAJ87_03680 [Candidatus Pacearchaeota archaeon]|nr:hypothetical protein [Candidatus Pacearchaeota archaeon]
MEKEDLDLADKHIELAEQIINEESKKIEKDVDLEKLKDALFSLEKAEANIEELKENC